MQTLRLPSLLSFALVCVTPLCAQALPPDPVAPDALDPAQSILVVDRGATFLNGFAKITVIPIRGDGVVLGAGQTVVIQSTLGIFSGATVDVGDGTYTRVLAATALGTALISAKVNGTALDTTRTVTVVDPSNLGRVIGVDAEGNYHPFSTIQEAIDAGGCREIRREVICVKSEKVKSLKSKKPKSEKSAKSKKPKSEKSAKSKKPKSEKSAKSKKPKSEKVKSAKSKKPKSEKVKSVKTCWIVETICEPEMVRILVSPGTYEEFVRVHGRTSPLLIEGLALAGPAFIRGLKIQHTTDLTLRYLVVGALTGVNHGMQIMHSDRIRVENCTVLGASGELGGGRDGLDVLKSKVIVGHCFFWRNRGAGIRVRNDAEVHAFQCLIESNEAAGIEIENGGLATIEECWFYTNQSYAILLQRGTTEPAAASRVTLLRNIFVGNSGLPELGISTPNIGNLDIILDPTDDQVDL